MIVDLLIIAFGSARGVMGCRYVKRRRSYPWDNWMQWTAGIIGINCVSNGVKKVEVVVL